jgi:hypothetical protein
MTPPASFLDTLKAATDGAAATENAFRREAAERIKTLERERVFAFRRFNLMCSIVERVTAAEDSKLAVAGSVAMLRAKLGWAGDSEAHSAVLSRFALVAEAVFATLAPPDEEAPKVDVIKSLAEFEGWYAESHATSFWVLFDHYVTETPVVDF